MRFFIAFLLTALLSFIASLWFDWWIIAVVGFLVAVLVLQKPWKSLLSGFLGIFILWGALAKWIDVENDSILSTKIASLLPLGGSPLLLILVTAFVGGLVAGLAALSGSYIRRSK